MGNVIVRKNTVNTSNGSIKIVNIGYGTSRISEGMFMQGVLEKTPTGMRYVYQFHMECNVSIQKFIKSLLKKMKKYGNAEIAGYYAPSVKERGIYITLTTKDDAIMIIALIIPSLSRDFFLFEISVISKRSLSESLAVFSIVKYIKEIEKKYQKELEQKEKENDYFTQRIYFKDSTEGGEVFSISFYKDFNRYYPLVNYLPIKQKIKTFEEKLEKLFSEDNKIIILEGPPGTGKTFYIKRMLSILHELSVSFTVKYYIGEAILHLSYSDIIDLYWENKNVIIILEEAEPLMVSKDERRNLHFTKLLNYSSGFLETKTIFILSTNRPVENIDPALIREGRLLAYLRFENFRKEEDIIEWCRFHKADEEKVLQRLREKRELSLAELYAILKEKESIKTESNKTPLLGFLK